METPALHSFSLSVSSLHFQVVSADLPLLVGQEKSYAHFRAFDGEQREGAISLSVRRGGIPDRSRLEKVFSTHTWILYGSGEDRIFFWTGEGRPRRVLWAARVSRRGRSGEIFCGEEMVRRDGGRESLDNPLAYPLDQLLTMHFLGGEGLIVHAAAAVPPGGDGGARLFAGVSGAGKTTISRILEGAGWRMLSDDRAVVRKSGDGAFEAWGTPWPGEGGYALNEGAPLGGICFLSKGERNERRRLEAREALGRLFPVVSLPWYDREKLDANLALCGTLTAAAFDLTFKPDASVVETPLSARG